MRTISIDARRKVIVITDPREARKFIEYLSSLLPKALVALDFETTGLFPRERGKDQHSGARVRLTNISWNETTAYILAHDYCGSFYSLVDDMIDARSEYYVFHAPFETKWFDAFCDEEKYVRLFDVANMRKSVQGGGPLSLKTMVKYDLDIDMMKEGQLSDWSAEKLTDEQYIYAGLDAIYTHRLAALWSAKMNDGHWQGFHNINNSVGRLTKQKTQGFY